jgi:crotonobetainyl-CoA:carnitine CoA-transferase CaiB-like acyl-CoA transferase
MPENDSIGSASGPLKGIRVLDFGAFLAGSYHATLMGDLGADVIKIEPIAGDPTRLTPPIVGGESRVFLGWNRNKRGLAVDLRSERGLKVVYDLIRSADVLTCNFRPASARKLKMDYDTLSHLNPSLIYCSSTGFGPKGPMADRPSYDGVFQTIGGIAQVNETTAGNVSIAAPVFVDIQTATLALSGVLAALYHRERTGEGQQVETSLLQAVMAVQPHAYCEALDQEEEGIVGAHPYTLYETTDGHVFVACPQEKFWKAFCTVIEKPELGNDERYDSLFKRVECKDELLELISPVMMNKSADEWEQLLVAAEVPCAPALSHAEFMEHPQVSAMDMNPTIEHPKIGPLRVFGVPFNFSKTPGNIQRAAPALGEHTREILAELDYTDGEIESLKEDGAIGL